MVFTIHRYILKELLKVFLLTTVALTLMLSFGSLLKPIQEFGVGPTAVIRLLGYFLPITLTFVLPISAVFAASLVYGRFASDNELDACRASGISLWMLIYPGLALAVSVAITTLLLSFYVVPNYVHRAERAVKADAKQILFRNIDRKGYYVLPASRNGTYRIWADLVHPENDELEGVIVAQEKQGQVLRLITAKRARVSFETRKHAHEVIIVAYDLDRFDDTGRGSSKEFTIAGPLGSLLTDNIKFKEIDELHEIRADVMQFYPVNKLATETYMQLITELMAQDITRGAAGPEPSYQLEGKEINILLAARKCSPQKDSKLELTGKVTIIENDNSQAIPQSFTYKCEKALLQVQNTADGPRIEMVLTDAEWVRKDGTRGLTQNHVVSGLAVPKNIQDRLKGGVLFSVNNMPEILPTPSKLLMDMQTSVNKKIVLTLSEIASEINWRLVFGIGCIFLILIGSGLGIMLRGGHLLTAFGVSSIPAAILIVCLMTGKNMATHKEALGPGNGILLMWTGLALMIVLTVAVYRKLLKH